MVDQKNYETCPSCKVGRLLRIEQRADGHTKYFSCGHKNISVGVADKLSFHDSVRFKANQKGSRRPFIEGKSGDDLHRKSGKWMVREMTIDRTKNRYKEKITDPDAGKIIHCVEEPLSKHRGHGSAKSKTRSR